ncbi:hypothetical protein [Paenibacillus agricola]|uniref:Uncharacterized protein n=1 Tax=Paenibacillus agricola TaxID=2716264 RepID=A0ABX0J020_9BACL|nr:hypothetical protein [Paenibacillus agricola]NHN29028.1 hypothetical protein [Paenibacillus agricola]
MSFSEFVTDEEYTDVLEGVKDLLKETYRITDNEAISVISNSREKADEFLIDYYPYLNNIKDLHSGLRDTLDVHFQEVDQAKELQIKMSHDAAAWLTFECIRKLYTKSFSKIY